MNVSIYATIPIMTCNSKCNKAMIQKNDKTTMIAIMTKKKVAQFLPLFSSS